MPNWKKVIVSGSDASLNALTVSNGITGSLLGTASYANNGGVTQIIAGTNVSLSPTSGLGAVTVNASVTYGAGTNTTASFTNASSWSFTHNLNTQYPVIQVYDTNYNQIIPQNITLTDANTATITFPGNESGYVIASVGGVGVSAATASYVLNAISSSYSRSGSYAVSSSYSVSASYYGGSVTTASFASTASYVNTLAQAVTIGNVTGTPAAENTLNLYPPIPTTGTGEGGQLMLAASGGLYTSASMLDTYQNYFRILKGTNAGSTAQVVGLDLQTGNLSVAGAVIPSAWSAGDVIQMRVFKPGDSGVYAVGTSATGTSNECFFSCSFTPKSTTSYIVAEMYAKYEPAGGGNDDFFSTITVNGPSGTEMGYSYQKFSSSAGADRSGVLFPLSGRYTNTTTATKTICANMRRGTSDDNIALDSSNASSMTMIITEIGR